MTIGLNCTGPQYAYRGNLEVREEKEGRILLMRSQQIHSTINEM